MKAFNIVALILLVVVTIAGSVSGPVITKETEIQSEAPSEDVNISYEWEWSTYDVHNGDMHGDIDVMITNHESENHMFRVKATPVGEHNVTYRTHTTGTKIIEPNDTIRFESSWVGRDQNYREWDRFDVEIYTCNGVVLKNCTRVM